MDVVYKVCGNFVVDLACVLGRYVSQQRYSEAIDLLRDGAMSLLRANQISSGADLGLLLINTLDKANAPMTEKNIGNTAVLYKEYSPQLYVRYCQETLLTQ